MQERDVYVLVGPTASGKSDVGQVLAERMGGAILSADSMLVYRGMDIGTAKPDQALRGSVPYLGIDLVGPDQGFDVWQYVEMIWDQLVSLPEEVPVIVVGGSGLYVKALVEGLDQRLPPPSSMRGHWEQLLAEDGVEGLQEALRVRDADVLAALDDPQNPRRLIRALERAETVAAGLVERTWSTGQEAVGAFAGLMTDPAVLRHRIAERVERMYAGDGLLAEVRSLQEDYPCLSDTARQAIGYREAFDVLGGACSLAEAKARTIVRTNRLAKRQRTWFRHQSPVDWFLQDGAFDVEFVADSIETIWRRHGRIRIKRK